MYRPMLTALNPFDRNQPFPDVSLALDDPKGLLAVGVLIPPPSGQRLPAWHLSLVQRGRANIVVVARPPAGVVSRKVPCLTQPAQDAEKAGFSYSYDLSFDQVMDACAEPRAYADATWISPQIKRAYCQLHQLDLAHSFEAWREGDLVGGLYGLSLGGVFFGESMFHRASNASKAAFAFAVDQLLQWGYRLIDCQVYTGHLASLGAEEIPRTVFIDLLDDYCDLPVSATAWHKVK